MRHAAALILAVATLAACTGEIYVRDGVTDGNMFSIAPFAAANPDPVVQSWIRYSLALSVCQLESGAENPARASSFDCERHARKQLADAWDEKSEADPAIRDAYLDDLSFVRHSGYLDEYVADYFARGRWSLPADLDMNRYRRWHRNELRGHRPETRIIGSWSYRRSGKRTAAD